MSTVGGVYEVYTHPYDVISITGINIHERLCSASQLRPAPACGVSTTWWCSVVVLSGGDGNGGPAQPAGCGAGAVLEPSVRRHLHHQPPPV